MEQLQTITVGTLIKTIASSKGLTIKKVADRCGKAPCTMSQIISRGKINMTTFRDILDAMDESVVITLSNGNKYKLEI